MVHIFAGGTNCDEGTYPAKISTHFRGGCTNSRANLFAGARLRGGERIRCYTGFDVSVSDEQGAAPFLVSFIMFMDSSDCGSPVLDSPNSSWSIAGLKEYLR